MRMSRVRNATMVAMIGAGSFLFQSCPIGGLVDDCFGDNTISESAFDDMNFFERMAYDENDCGRYERGSGPLSDWF